MESDDDLTRRYRKTVHVGRSKRKNDDEPPTLDEALRDAYDKASGGRGGKYRLLDIWVRGDNPLSEVIVSLEKD
jgi:hypothetical protein